MSGRDELLAACRAAPEDDRPLLVYADWLQESGDALGELIQVSVQAARKGSERLRARERELETQLFPGPIRWKFANGRVVGVGHSGVFRGKERVYPSGHFWSWLCLHPDGRALDASSSGDGRFEAGTGWADRNREGHQGRVTIDGWAVLGREPKVPISIWTLQEWMDGDESHSVRLDYEGFVAGATLELSIHSDRTGLTWDDVFGIVDAPGHDSRVAGG